MRTVLLAVLGLRETDDSDPVLRTMLVVVGIIVPVLPARAQIPASDSSTLAERYRTARLQRLVQPYLTGHRTLPIQSTRPVPVRIDSLLGPTPDRDTTASPTQQPRFSVNEVRRVRDLERSWFQDRYRDVEWAFLGTSTQFTVFDTTRTRDLRARLQAQFGEPTRTMAEVYSREWRRAPDSTRDPPIQFEYWFIVNDSMPVRVMDVNGPSDRGVIVSTRRRHRHQLHALRAALLRPLRTPTRAPYVDYYYESETGRWYRVGFDGTDFFRERISRFDILSGRRPSLDTARIESSTEADASSSSSTP